MREMTWADYAVVAKFYLEAAVKIEDIRRHSVRAVVLAADSEANTPHQARRLTIQAELMEKDPLGAWYGRHKHEPLQGELRTPLEWPDHIPTSEWQPVNDAAENLRLAHAAMQASLDLMARSS